MVNRLHFSFSLILFIILIVLTIWLDQITRPPEQNKDNDSLRAPDYIVEDLSGSRLDHEHAIQRKFTARKLSHYVKEEVTQLEQVGFINIDLQKPLLRLQADRAEIRNKGNNIFLMDNVTAIRGEDQEKGKITLMTHFLHLLPKESLVKTDQGVTITRLLTTINAQGMELDNRTGKIELLSQVKAVDMRYLNKP